MSNSFDKFLEEMDYGNIDGIACQVFHPKIRDGLKAMVADPDFKDMWTERLTPAQRQFRACMTVEICEMIAGIIEEEGNFEDLESLVALVITITFCLEWIARDYESQS